MRRHGDPRLAPFGAFRVCASCRESLLAGRVPPLSKSHGYAYPPRPADLPDLNPHRISTKLDKLWRLIETPRSNVYVAFDLRRKASGMADASHVCSVRVDGLRVDVSTVGQRL
ncbi:hypothetical protein MRX96_046983 [Rhipicephalus microplus]